jgi:hypothetical protein
VGAVLGYGEVPEGLKEGENIFAPVIFGGVLPVVGFNENKLDPVVWVVDPVSDGVEAFCAPESVV